MNQHFPTVFKHIVGKCLLAFRYNKPAMNTLVPHYGWAHSRDFYLLGYSKVAIIQYAPPWSETLWLAFIFTVSRGSSSLDMTKTILNCLT
jgi:hypothetical protein